MYQTLSAEMKNGRIKLLDKARIPEGARVPVTVIPEDESMFWKNASRASLDKIWMNEDDNVYEKLLVK